MTPHAEESIKYLKKVAHDHFWTLTAIREKGEPTITCSFNGADDATLVPWLERLNTFDTYSIYYALNPLRRPMTKKASREDVKSMAWLHVDVDLRAGEDIEAEQDRILKMLQNPPGGVPKPTAIIFSGGGYQALWKLAEPVPIDGQPTAYEEAKRYNQQLELIFGADNCHNVDRILRVPHTVNHPNANKRKKGRTSTMAELVEWHDDRVYPLDVFDKAPAQVAVTVEKHKAKVDTVNVNRVESLDDLPDGMDGRAKILIAQGHDPDDAEAHESRSEAVFAVCCAMVRAGCDDDTIFSILTDPDWGISESIIEKKSGATRYALRQIERAREKVGEASEWVVKMNEEYFIVQDFGGRCMVGRERENGTLSFQSPNNFEQAHARERVVIGEDANGNPKYAPKGKAYLNHPQAREYSRCEYLPGKKTSGRIYNTFTGWAFEPKAGDTPLFVNFIRDVIAGDHFDFVMDWIAHMVQRPWEPAQVALAFRGRQGHGKSFFTDHVGQLLGPGYQRVTDPRHLLGNFNAHLDDKLLVNCDEVFGTAEKRSQGILKTLVTAETILIERKGVDARLCKRYFRLILTSNESWVVPADLDDRRFFVADVRHPLEDEQDRFDYFAEVERCWQNGGREAFLDLLLNRDISGFNHRERPKTAALVEQKQIHVQRPEEVHARGATGRPDHDRRGRWPARIRAVRGVAGLAGAGQVEGDGDRPGVGQGRRRGDYVAGLHRR